MFFEDRIHIKKPQMPCLLLRRPVWAEKRLGQPRAVVKPRTQILRFTKNPPPVLGKAAKAGYRWQGRSAAAPGRMHRFLRNASANSQLPNGPAESPAPTELRRIRTALQSSTAKLIYRTHSNATICNSSCTVTGGAYHSARRVSMCARSDYKAGACMNCTRRMHQT